MSDKRNPMELFLDRFKDVNYVRYQGNEYVEAQLDHTAIDSVQFSAITQVLIEDEGARLRRSVNVNTPGYLVAYNQRWTTAFLLSPEASTLNTLTPVHVDTLDKIDYADVLPYYETPPDIGDLPVGTESVKVRVKLGVSVPDSVPDKRRFVWELLYPFSKFEFTREDLTYVGDDYYLLDTPTVYEHIRVFRFGIAKNTLTIPKTYYGKMRKWRKSIQKNSF